MAHDLEPLIGLFQLLGDKTRLHILMELAKGERNVSSLCEQLRLPQPTVSHHLGLLRSKNLICNRRLGRQIYYDLHVEVARADGAVTFSAASHSVQIQSAALK
jgi:DNA-binding transcriptional ArsR family regulator